MSRRVGLQSRFQLNRRLQKDGLPSYGDLADWVAVLSLLWQSEASGRSLLGLAERAGLEPATCYRRCRRTLGVPWRAARARGFSWGLVLFIQRCSRQRVPPKAPDILPAPERAPGLHPSTDRPISPEPAPTLRGPSPGTHPTHPQGVIAFRIPVPDAPTDVGVSRSGVVYVTRAYAAALARVDVEGRCVVRSIDVGVNPTRIAFHPRRPIAYVTNQFGGSISVVDLTTEHRVAEIVVPGDPAPLAVAPDGRTLFVSTNHDVLYAVSTGTRRILQEAPLPATSHHLTLHPHAPRLYLSTRTAGSVMEMDLPTLHARRTFEVGGQTQAMAVAPDGRELYVADELGAVHVINLETGTPAATVHLPGGAYGLDLTPDGAQLYVAMPGQGRVHIMDRATRRLTHTVVTDGMPRHTAFAAGGRTGLIVNEGGWVTVVW